MVKSKWTRFRCGRWAMQGDLKTMFWQIKLTESDELFHGVVYRDETFVITRVCPIIADDVKNFRLGK